MSCYNLAKGHCHCLTKKKGRMDVFFNSSRNTYGTRGNFEGWQHSQLKSKKCIIKAICRPSYKKKCCKTCIFLCQLSKSVSYTKINRLVLPFSPFLAFIVGWQTLKRGLLRKFNCILEKMDFFFIYKNVLKKNSIFFTVQLKLKF